MNDTPDRQPDSEQRAHSERTRRAAWVPRLQAELQWPDATKGPWTITLWFGEVQGRMECVGFDVRAFRTLPDGRPAGYFDRDPEPLLASRLREIPFRRLVNEHLEQFAEHLTDVSEQGGREALGVEKPLQALAHTPSRKRAGRRPEYGPDHFRDVARIYSAAYTAGLDSPTQTVADRFQVSKSTAAKWVAQARHQMGFLPPTSRGRAAGVVPAKKRKGKR